MSNLKKRSYTNVAQKDHNYINSLVNGETVSNQGEAISEVVNNNLLFSELGLNSAKVEKLRMVTNMLSESDNNITLKSLVTQPVSQLGSMLQSIHSILVIVLFVVIEVVADLTIRVGTVL